MLDTAAEHFVSGVTLPLDWAMGFGNMLYVNTEEDQAPYQVGFIANGLWTLDDASQTPGGPVTGSVVGEIWSWAE